MKKSKYISKYDFINYYAKPQGLWFFTNSEIKAAINWEFQKLNLKTDDGEESEINEVDAFEIYQELVSENKNIDLDNPLLIEGNIIDQNSKKYIKSLFNDHFKIIDFDIEYQNQSNEEKAVLCTKIIQSQQKVILFQPVFISQIHGVDVITKPDCVVINNNNFLLYETKGTSSTKKHHFLDMYFQAKVIESIQFLKNKFNFNYFLCIVAFTRANKKECPLIHTPYCNIGKTVNFDMKKWRIDNFNEEKILEFGQSIKMGEWTSKKVDYEFYPLSIVNFVHENLDELNERILANPAPNTIKACHQFQEDALKMFASFKEIIYQLNQHKLSLNNQSIPVINKPGYGDKSEWKNCEFFGETRQIYAAKGYKLLNYSGNVMNQTQEALCQYNRVDNLINWVKCQKEIPKYEKFFFQEHDVVVPKENVSIFLKKFKDKKVYFDFETINTAIRAYDNTLPFRQIITQSSVIIDQNNGAELFCNNLIVDPLKIDKNWFKKIIDSLYQGSDFSYIVYNKSFEQSRLDEIKDYLDDQLYISKINVIIDNLIDLAELFNVGKKHGIIFKKLGGFYSIKKVLPLVSQYDPNIFMSVNCHDYQKLKINNGKVCQDKTAARFFNLMNTKEWIKTSHDLKIYCENDVRAMIAVEYFVKKLVDNYYSNLKINFV